LERNGFEVNYAVLFDRPTELKGGIDGMTNFIEMFFNWIFTDISVEDKNAAMKKTCEKLKKTSFKNHTWIADYRRIQVMAMKIQ
jgi:hypothetical protein